VKAEYCRKLALEERLNPELGREEADLFDAMAEWLASLPVGSADDGSH
jgi:hypothetical protein